MQPSWLRIGEKIRSTLDGKWGEILSIDEKFVDVKYIHILDLVVHYKIEEMADKWYQPSKPN